MPDFSITCLVDNHVKFSSKLWGEHGLSFLVDTPSGQFLFDSGQSGEVLSRNISQLNLNIENVHHIVLSHGHYDHTGGISWLFNQLSHPIIHADPAIFTKKYSIRNENKKYIGLPLSRSELEKHSDLILTVDIQELYPDVFISGRIPRVNQYEIPDNNLYTIDEQDDDKLIQDPVIDDRCIIIKSDIGLIVLLGCCHSGIINTLTYVSQLQLGNIYAVIGGAHMANIPPNRLNYTLSKLKQDFHPYFLYLNHCTGSDTLFHMRNYLGENVKPCPAGTVLEY